jgi:hypothetical protein
MKLKWWVNRLRTMRLQEVVHRGRQSLDAFCEQKGIGAAHPCSPVMTPIALWTLPVAQQVDAAKYSSAADAVLRGRFNVFELRHACLGFPPRWNCDPRTGVVAPLSFGKKLNYRDARLVGDVKYLWEPNRHLELVALAQAWHLTQQERYAAGCRSYLESWFDQCPYPLGANWSSSLELAIRLVNWAFAWQFFGGWESRVFDGADGHRFRDRWLTAIYQHCHFIAGYPSLYSSANNHLIGEKLGLFVAATTWPLWRESLQWRGQAQHQIYEESLRQNAPDGVNREQSTWYQHEVMDMMIIAGLVARSSGTDFEAPFWLRLEAMCEFIASIMDARGHVPAIGDADDARIVRLTADAEHDVFRSLLATGAVLFRRGDFKAKAREFDDKSRWLLGDQAAEEFDRLAVEGVRLPVRREYPSGGYYILGSDFESRDEVRVVADAGPLGYLSIAAHGHADALSFTLSVGGDEFLIDPGTYVYQANAVWREYFRGSVAHNTVVIDGVGQSVSGGPFLWVRHARTLCDEVEISDQRQIVSAWHDGYRRLGVPVHRRTWSYDAARRELTVADAIESRSRHWINMHWHFAAECIVRISGQDAIAERDGVVCKLTFPTGMNAKLALGSEHPPLGWQSKRFDSKTPASTIVASRLIEGSWQGLTRISVAASS